MSIFPAGDIRESINLDPNDADVCILEEPEHLTTTSSPTSLIPWNQTFNHVVGIMHTNYQMYVSKANVSGVVTAPIVSFFSACLTRVHCDRIIKLSDTLQTYAAEKECVNNVHGIRSDFLEEGKRRAAATCPSTNNKIYFIGKLLWAKGLDNLIELENAFKRSTGDYFDIEIVGSGPEADEIQRAYLGRSKHPSFSSQGSLSQIMNDMPKSIYEFRKDSIPAIFPGRMDHAVLTEDYKIFVNPSLTEVLCTTTAEVSWDATMLIN